MRHRSFLSWFPFWIPSLDRFKWEKGLIGFLLHLHKIRRVKTSLPLRNETLWRCVYWFGMQVQSICFSTALDLSSFYGWWEMVMMRMRCREDFNSFSRSFDRGLKLSGSQLISTGSSSWVWTISSSHFWFGERALMPNSSIMIRRKNPGITWLRFLMGPWVSPRQSLCSMSFTYGPIIFSF